MGPASQPNEPWATKQGGVLIVDRDPLSRWSLAAYLDRWFDVKATGCPVEARDYIESLQPSALVVSDELPIDEMLAIESAAKAANSNVRVIRTISTVVDAKRPDGVEHCYLEKPFQLAELAEMLGVSAEDLARANG